MRNLSPREALGDAPELADEPSRLRRLRASMYALALTLGLAAALVLIPELIGPAHVSFPLSGTATPQAARDRARLAANLALFRGDLWGNYAAALGEGLTSDIAANASAASKSVEAAGWPARRAVSLAPHDAGMWLLIAALEARLDSSNRGVQGPLKLSYYTGAADQNLMGLRLRVATRSQAISDSNMQLLVSGDLRAIVSSAPALKSAIIMAYRDALAPGRQFIADALADLDPTLLETVTANSVVPR